MYNKTIEGKQMNIKTITLMDFDWGDFIGAMKVNIRTPPPSSPCRITTSTIASLSCTFGHLFKLNSFTMAITKTDISLAEIKDNRRVIFIPAFY